MVDSAPNPVDCTKVVPMDDRLVKCGALDSRLGARTMSENDWIEQHASGTLRKNKRLNFSWKTQYLHERVAFEFGYAFEILPKSRVLWGVPITEGDCKPLTEAGWFADRYLRMNIFPEDYFECKYIYIDPGRDSKREGVGLVCRQTSAPWIPAGNIIFAIVAEFDPKTDSFKAAVNPC